MVRAGPTGPPRSVAPWRTMQPSSNATARAALVVAVLALVAALGGSAYAAAAINGRNLVNRSVGGVKLANDTVTGAQVKESTLRGLVRPPALRGLARSADFRRIRMEVTTTSAVSRQVLAYTWVTVATSLVLWPVAGTGWLYPVAAVVLGGAFLVEAHLMWWRARTSDELGVVRPMRLFHYSITYLSLLFVAVALDPLVTGVPG